MLFTSLRILIVCGFFAAVVYAQTIKPETASKLLIKAPVWIETTAGQFWQEGKRPSFKVFLDEQEVVLKSLQGPASSTVVLVVFDTVVDLTRLAIARTALTEALATLPEYYWIGLMRAQDGLTVLQEPTANRTALAEKIQSIQVNGHAGLLDTLDPVARLATSLQQKANVRVNVLYVTDSGVANYRADLLNPVINSSDTGDLSRRFADRAVQERMSRLAQDMAEFTIPFYILHLAYRADTLNLAYQSGLERVAADAGGLAFFCRTNDEIASSLDLLWQRLRGGYVLSFEAAKLKHRTAKLRVEAFAPDGKPFERVQHASQLTVQKK